MGKKLAILGHLTRSKEVIELLEMMGGKNTDNADGCSFLYYTLCTRKTNNPNNDKVICGFTNLKMQNDHFAIFTLEMFWKKYPFKVGDKVFLYDNITEGCVTGMEWDEDKGTVKYCVYTSAECWCDVNELLKWNAIDLVEKRYEKECEEMCKDITLKHLYELGMENIKDKFRKDFCERCGSQRCSGQDDELEDCERFKNLIDNLGKTSVKNHKMGPKSKLPSKYYEDRIEEMKSKREYDELRMPLDDDDKLATEATIMNKRILPPDGYLIGKITPTDNGMLVEYVEKKPTYPNTYKECCDVLLISPYYNLRYHTYEHCYSDFATSDTLLSLEGKLNTLGKLLICRDAYWKILGEEMGLGKPWEPDWSKSEPKYVLVCTCNGIEKQWERTYCKIFAFPTEEIRDTFYENFKDLIEQCKELL